MNKILISVEKETLSFSKYTRNISEENLNNTNVIDVKSLKFTEEYITENAELVMTFLNLIVLKTDINKVIIKNLDIAEVSLKLIKGINNIKYVTFKEDKVLTYTISQLLFENKNLEFIECYSLPNIMFQKFDKGQIKTRGEILSNSKFLEYNNIKTFSDLFNKEKIIIGPYLEKEDINPLIYLLENNKHIKKIEFKEYNKKNLEATLFYVKSNDLKKVDIIIYEDEKTTQKILDDIKLFEKLNKQYNVNIKIKYSKKYRDKNKIKELNIVLLRNIVTSTLLVGLILLFGFKLSERKNNKQIEKIQEKINEIVVPLTIESVNKVQNNAENQKNENSEQNNVGNQSDKNKEQYVSSYYKNYSKVHSELLELNSDTVGWLTVNNTKINYPVVQSKDNDYYLNHAYDKSNNLGGWIFVDYRNDMDLISKNTIIYGHNISNSDLMFSTLKNVLDSNWYSNANNLNINFSIKDKEYTWKIFSIYTIEVTSDYLYTEFNTDNDYLNFLQKLKDRSINNFNEELTIDDKILTLSTCYKDDNQRVVVHARLIN